MIYLCLLVSQNGVVGWLKLHLDDILEGLFSSESDFLPLDSVQATFLQFCTLLTQGMSLNKVILPVLQRRLQLSKRSRVSLYTTVGRRTPLH